MAFEIKAPNDIPTAIKRIKPTYIFTAGSIEMGKAEKWQDKLVKAFIDNDNLVFLNPRRDDWDSSWVQDPTSGTQFHTQVSWELNHIELSDIVVFYFDPKTQSPISLLELGLCLNSNKPVIIYCPKDYFRYGNVVITANQYNQNVLVDYDLWIEEIKKLIS